MPLPPLGPVGMFFVFQFDGSKSLAVFSNGEGVVQKWPVLGNTDNKNPAARQGWF
jgi:hypothetical protein